MLNLKTLKKISQIAFFAAFLVALSGMSKCSLLEKMFGCSSSNCTAAACSSKKDASAKDSHDHSKDWICLGKVVSSGSSKGEILAKIQETKNIGFTVELLGSKDLSTGEVESRIAMFAGGQLPADFSLTNLPPETLKNMVDEILKLKLIVAEHAQKVLSTAQAKEALAKRIQLVIDGFVFEEYVKSTREELTVSNDEIKAEYNENKARYVKEIGGVTTIACKFEDQDAAQEFAAVLAGKGVSTTAAFNDEARAFGKGIVRDFNRISKEVTRGAPEAIVAQALDTKRFPTTEVITVSQKEAWVVLFADSKPHTYFSLDERKEWIKRGLEQKKAEERFSADAEKYKKKLGLEMTEAYNNLVNQNTMPITSAAFNDNLTDGIDAASDGQLLDDEMADDQQLSAEELQALIRQAQDEEESDKAK